MKNIKDLRIEIDEIDIKLKELLNQRFNLSKEIGAYKIKNNIKTRDNTREKEIISKLSSLENSQEVSKVYETIFFQSKKLQKKYFLVGKRLNYSFSKTIHEMFGNENYSYLELDNFNDIQNFDFLGINITNPFKQDAYNWADEHSKEASRTKMVNTLIKLDNKIIGFNTDYLGFKELLSHYQLDVKNKVIGILGNGNTSLTIKAVLEDLGAKSIYQFARHKKENTDLLFRDFNKIQIDILINTTSFNVYPNLEVTPLISLKSQNNLKTIIDVNYNPERSILALKNKNIDYINGLWMLIYQAKISEEIFNKYLGLNNCYAVDPSLIYKAIRKDTRNIVLIGMPYAGKSYIGKILSSSLGYEFYDTDEILEEIGEDLLSMLEKGLEVKDFRKQETKLINELSLKNKAVISTGGGAILNEDNILKLSQNGIIIFLNPPFETLLKRQATSSTLRPLSNTPEILKKIYDERLSFYKNLYDLEICSTDSTLILNKIKEILENENINN